MSAGGDVIILGLAALLTLQESSAPTDAVRIKELEDSKSQLAADVARAQGDFLRVLSSLHTD